MSNGTPLRERDKARKIIDITLIVFYIFNFIFISYMFDIEQVVVLDHSTYGTAAFTYPAWPPKFIVDLNHWVGTNFDPALLERPTWWRATIWIDIILFGPFYAVAAYAFIRGKNWIRIPSIIWYIPNPARAIADTPTSIRITTGPSRLITPKIMMIAIVTRTIIP